MAGKFDWNAHPVLDSSPAAPAAAAAAPVATPGPAAAPAQATAKFDWGAHPVAESKTAVAEKALDTPAGRNMASRYLNQHPNLKALVKGGLEQLPFAGAIAGGAVGGAAGAVEGIPTAGVASIPLAAAQGMIGAGVGGGVGKGLQNLGEEYLLDQDKTNAERLLSPIGTAAESAAGEGIGQALHGALASRAAAKELQGVKDAASQYGRPIASDVEAAAKRLGVKPTPGMLSDSYVTRNLESSIGQNPTIPGMLIREKQEPVRKSIQATLENVLKDATHESPVVDGRKMRNGLIADISERYQPIQMAYDDIQKQTKHIALDEGSLKRVARNIRGMDEATILPNSSESRMAEDFAKSLENVKNVDQIKMLNTKAGQILADKNASYGEKQVAAGLQDRLARLHKNSIMRAAIEADANPETGKEMGRQLMADAKEAGRAYRAHMEDLSTLNKGSGLAKETDKTAATLNKISQSSPEDIAGQVFDAGNSEYLNFLRDKHPQVYETARAQKLRDIANRSMTPQGDIDAGKFTKAIKSLTPEARDHIFGTGSAQRIADMDTLTRSIPGKVGASDTPRGMAFREYLSPTLQAADVGRYVAYKRGEDLTKFVESPAGQAAIKGLIQKTIPTAGKAGSFGAGLLMRGRSE